MSVISPARPTSQTADYGELGPHTKALLDHALEQADNTVDNAEFRILMETAASLAKLDIPRGHDIAKCACPDCHCGALFDTAAPGLRTVEDSNGYNLPLLQCARCADEHPVPDED
ncbi:hypothetical protein XF35_39130 [Streptomyces platensis subsp. clarensis]|uniref:Uncharacterized protein n=1 Tax=Streptomyces showdoensis TaxID=68268 RepID=A0A2P2GMP7_STREW|nr:hypothetical protein [Streptomyces showdoensis]KKZ72095.1 hypothetical protein VO63_20165 [Streptomyces showdoensis]MCW7991072.1 hypothetical protein [Streptomyces platensis subsp. clarensis]